MVDVFLKVLDMSVTASWVILAVMAARVLIRKAPKKYSYALWVVALFRLLCPVSLQSVVSAFNFRPFRQAAQTTGELQFIPRENIPQIDTGIPVVDTVINTKLPVLDTVVDATVPAVDTVVNSNVPAAVPEAALTPMETLLFVGMAAWVIGMLALVIVSVVNYIRLRKDLRFATRMEGNVWQCETVRSPFLVGLIKPKIYIPYGLDEQTQGYILAHERYHLKRFDHIAKLLGYAALTLHWFNPLCHLAFRQMNSDMEMSCDEYVLDRNNIPTTQYSYSLLTIATNRRFPAATPLAFAETGVKERMINVLKWKRPKKWVSVVAVMVCLILLISCATNPKVTIPTENTAADIYQVDDPAMLEYPGLKWGMSPEEVIEALQLTEEQIQSQTYSGGDSATDSCYLTVKDITLFDAKVTKAAFSFRRATKGTGNYRLYEVNLLLDENLDMNEMNRTLTEIYGEGTGKSYTTYGIDGRGELVERQKGGDPILAYMYNNLPNGPGKDTERMREIVQSIVEDPEFMVENWASSKKGSNVLPQDGQELIVKSWVDGGVAERETVEQWLEKAILVAITTQNRSLSAALEASRNSKPSESNVTHNQVIYNADMLIYFLETIERLSPVGDPALLEFPGLKWGVSVEEVKTALNIQEEQISTDDFLEATNFDTHLLHVKDITFFGEEVSLGCFKFRSVDEENLGLSYVMLFLDEDTDMEHLQAELSYHYQNQGTGETFDTCQWNIKDKVNYDPEEKDRPGEYELEEGKSRGGDAELWRLVNNPPSGSGYNFYKAALKVVEDPEFKTYNWVSPVKFTEVISSEGQNALKEAYETYSNIDPSLTQKFLENRPTVRMSISNRTWQAARVELEGITEGELTLATHNLVILDAQTLIELQYEAQRLQKILESE